MYKRLLYVEFLEFIGRVASEKYKTTSDPLYVKVERVLDDLLGLVGVLRKEMVSVVQHEEPDSDDSYGDFIERIDGQ